MDCLARAAMDIEVGLCAAECPGVRGSFRLVNSWASLQGFIIASGDLHPAIAWLTPMRVNVAFILVGSLSTTALVVIDIIVARASVSMWDDYRQLQAFLLVANGRWTEGALNTADVQLATVYWNDWLDHLSRIVK